MCHCLTHMRNLGNVLSGQMPKLEDPASGLLINRTVGITMIIMGVASKLQVSRSSLCHQPNHEFEGDPEV